MAGPGVLWVTAVGREADAVWRGLGGVGATPAWPGGFEAVRVGGDAIVVCGVGKAGGAGATAACVVRERPKLVVSAGVGGALDLRIGLGEVVVGGRSVDGDEGVQTPGGFEGVASMGFPPGPGGRVWYEPPAVVRGVFERAGCSVGTMVTVSTCSGTEVFRREVVARTGGAVEAMEGAAVLRAAAHLGVAGVEVRAISNTTGDRAGQRWDLDGALGALSGVVGRAREGLGAFARDEV